MRIGMYASNEYVTPLAPGRIHGVITLANGLVSALTKRGHHVDYFSPTGSHTKAHTQSLGYKPFTALPIHQRLGASAQRRLYSVIYSQRMMRDINVHARNHKLDLLHFHNLQEVLPLLPFLTDRPAILTVHESFFADESATATFNHFSLKLYQDLRQLYVITISKRQRQGLSSFPFFGTVYDGIDTSLYPYNPTPKPYLFFSGRLIAEKGPDVAIQAAKQAGYPLKLAGVFDPRAAASPSYERKLRAALQQPFVKHYGKITPAQMAKLYGQAQAVLVPIQWEEPFGLVMVEAMACGTPVIAFKRGAAAELIKDGKTGFLVRTLPEMVRAIQKIPTLRRQACRDRVEQQFSTSVMAQRYEAVYQAALADYRSRR